MKTLFYFLSLYLFLHVDAYAQKNYIAIYKNIVPDSLAEAKEELRKYNAYDNSDRLAISYNFQDSSVGKSDSSIADIAIQKYFIQMRNFITNHRFFRFVCTPNFISKTSYYDFETDQALSNAIDAYTLQTFTHKTYNNTYVLHINENVITNFRAHTDNEDSIIEHFLIKTGDLSFDQTGNSQIINQWVCDEYTITGKPSITIWASSDIPRYVNPQILMPSIKRGIVKVEFKNGNSLELVSITTTDEVISNIKVKDPPKQLYDMLNIDINRW